MKKAITLIAILTALSTSANAEEKVEEKNKPQTSGWFQTLVGYNFTSNNPAIRFEGGHNIEDFGFYGMVDLLPEGKDKIEIEGVYTELRGWYDIIDELGLMIEFQGGSGLDDLLRVGLFVHGNVGDLSGHLRLMSIDSTGKAGQIGTYGALKLPAGFLIDVLAEYNFDYEGETNNLYTEFGAYWNIAGGLHIGSHTRMFFDFMKNIQDLQELGVLKYEF